jgi:hypothetical protein
MDTIRPLSLFLGVSGPTAFCFSPVAFTPPTRQFDKSTFEKVRSRLSLNFKFFSSNYALLAVGVTVVVSLLHPGMLLSVAIVWGLWSLHYYVETNSNSSIQFNVMGKDLREVLTKPRRAALLTLFSVLVIIFQCLLPMLTIFCLSTILILFHAIMRDPRDVESSSAFFRGGIDDDNDDTEDNNDENSESAHKEKNEKV